MQYSETWGCCAGRWESRTERGLCGVGDAGLAGTVSHFHDDDDDDTLRPQDATAGPAERDPQSYELRPTTEITVGRGRVSGQQKKR